MALPKLEVPTYQINLPSNGKPVTYRPFLVKEHKVLLTLSESTSDEVTRIVKDLIDVCTFNKLDVNNLPHFDIEYLFMQLRAKSIGENVDVVITCANCEERYDSSFNIENLKVENIGSTNNKVKITDNIVVEFGYPKFDSVVDLFNSDDIDNILELVKNCIIAVYDQDNVYEAKDQTKEELDEFVSSFTKEQFDKVEQFFVNSPKIVQVVETDCPKCNHHNTSRIEGLQNFFV